MAARRRWVMIAFGGVVLIIFIGIGAIIAVTAWFQQNLQVDTRSAAEAETEFDTVKKQFGDRPPLVAMRDNRPEISAERDKPTDKPVPKIETLYVLAWDSDEERLARFTIPFWLLRMKS